MVEAVYCEPHCNSETGPDNDNENHKGSVQCTPIIRCTHLETSMADDTNE